MRRVNPQLIICILASSGCAWINGAELDARQDMDGDGYIAQQFGGTDCDDTNDTIFPGAEETWYDNINQSCKVGSDFDQKRY